MNGAKPREIGLDQATAGMILAAALLDHHGGVLLPQDATLTDTMLAALQRRGVARCVVWDADALTDAASAAAVARERAQRLQRLERLFRHSGDEPGNALLLAQLRAYHGRDGT